MKERNKTKIQQIFCRELDFSKPKNSVKVEKENVNTQATQVCPMSDIESLTVSTTRETVQEESPEQTKLKVKVCETSPGSGAEIVNNCHVHICETNSENSTCLEAAKVYPINDFFAPVK